MMRQMPMRSPYSRSVTAAMFLLNTAFAGGIVCVPCRCKDSRVAKFSGQTSQGIINVTQILALSGHSITVGRGINSSSRRGTAPLLSCFWPAAYGYVGRKWIFVIMLPLTHARCPDTFHEHRRPSFPLHALRTRLIFVSALA